LLTVFWLFLITYWGKAKEMDKSQKSEVQGGCIQFQRLLVIREGLGAKFQNPRKDQHRETEHKTNPDWNPVCATTYKIKIITLIQ
jgi:hypothetical protein